MLGLLAVHLWHGIESMFQTFGLKTDRWTPWLRGKSASMRNY